MAKLLHIIEKRLTWERDYIEKLSSEDAKYQINSKGTLATENAYGEIMAQYDDGNEFPVICMHGGSMWLCRGCKIKILGEQSEFKPA